MTEDHEQILATLAAHALGALDESERREADEILAGHLPGCPTCRETLEGFDRVAGELGLAAEPRRPPRTLHARIRRDVRPERATRRRPALAGVAGALVLGGLLAWGAHLSGRVSRAEDQQVRTTEVLTAVTHPRSHLVPLSAQAPRSQFQLAATYVPGRPILYLFGSMPSPRQHRVYQLWLIRAGEFWSAGTFLPDEGHVLLTFHVDPASYEALLITEEPAPGSTSPSDRRLVMASL